MKSSSAPRAGPTALTREEAEVLAAELVEEMIQAWREGRRVLPEDFLGRYPGLWEHPESVAELIYEEMSLRREHGPEMPTEEVLRRFPQWRPQLEVLFDCHRILDPRSAVRFPAAGELVDDFLLIAELGRGGLGRIFLASQGSLANRPVVLKFTPPEALEHLSLARLQHTHIVPLHSVQDHPDRVLRSLCMPYFGGISLARLLEALRPTPPAQRTGQDLINALDEAEAAAPIQTPSQGTTRHALARASYVHTVCWIGACLADALHYAHERGLVHLDLKPSNVLLAADGQPMLLDFHLAREPVRAGETSSPWFGGTSGYMSPEQQDALRALREGKPVARPVDERSDVYSLGLLLYEALAGRQFLESGDARTLRRHNPQVSVGLADVIAKCLSGDPAQRYGDAAALAGDLRRHLTDRPLAGVRNRSLAERWRKWRRRRPHAAALMGMMLAVLTAAGAVAIGAAAYFTQRTEQAENALRYGQVQMNRGEWEGAVNTLQHGLSSARAVPFRPGLQAELSQQLRLAEKARADAERETAARQLHWLTDRLRFLYGARRLPPKALQAIAPSCRACWESRRKIVERLSADGTSALHPAVRDDLLDLAIFWADLQVRLAPAAAKEEARGQALDVLNQAEVLFGPSPVLDEERRFYGGTSPLRKPESRPLRAWEHYALGRALLRSGMLERAADELEQAVRLKPQDLWPNFYYGLCVYRLGRYLDAIAAQSVCIGAAPEAATCFYNRALAFAALGDRERALGDYDQALRLDPTFADALLNRGIINYRAKRYDAALADLQRAAELGADPAVVFFDLFLVKLAHGNYLRPVRANGPMGRRGK
jgi:serine/threonine protein kinase/tetratricopeptide (TPR) repeat protein